MSPAELHTFAYNAAHGGRVALLTKGGACIATFAGKMGSQDPDEGAAVEVIWKTGNAVVGRKAAWEESGGDDRDAPAWAKDATPVDSVIAP